jgi:hypothetical protein
MEIQELKKKVEGLRVNWEELDVDLTEIVEHAFFEKPGHTDYRKESIQYMVRNKIDFHSTCNSVFDVARMYLKFECPHCGKEMKMCGGGGAGLS